MCSLRTVLWLNVGLFSFIAAVHALRILFQWEVAVEGWLVGYWLNGLAIVLLGIMIYFNGKHLKKPSQNMPLKEKAKRR